MEGNINRNLLDLGRVLTGGVGVMLKKLRLEEENIFSFFADMRPGVFANF